MRYFLLGRGNYIQMQITAAIATDIVFYFLVSIERHIENLCVSVLNCVVCFLLLGIRGGGGGE